MTIGEHHNSPMLVEADRLRDTLVTAQLSINEATQLAELQATSLLRETLGMSAEQAEVDTAGLVDTRIAHKEPVISPRLMEHALPITEESARTTALARTAIGDILMGNDDRMILITGPCSIHNGEEALEYAAQVAKWRELYGDSVEIVMRAYFEKPRSEKGWKGLAYDPKLDGSHDIDLGLTYTRMIALGITEMGVPIATERLNAATPQYLNGLVAYDAIGARNIADQKAREYASGTSSPVGMKNGTDGSVKDAASAVVSANNSHTFLGTDMAGVSAEVETTGNELAHVILRGGADGPNYSPAHIEDAKKVLTKKNILGALVIDASHGNSGKEAANQAIVIDSIVEQVTDGEDVIKGVMLESNLKHGKQDLKTDSDLEYGVSVTDECIDVQETELLIRRIVQAVKDRRAALASAN
jgi:3-deoxy-7-phosphoheptulonate synthase